MKRVGIVFSSLLLLGVGCTGKRIRVEVGGSRVSDVVRNADEGDIIELEEGIHYSDETIVIPKNSITLVGLGSGATISSGVTIDRSQFKPVPGAPSLLQADLSNLIPDLGQITTSPNLGHCTNNKTEAFAGPTGRRLRLARHPNVVAGTNQPLWTWMTIDKVVNEFSFTFRDQDKAAFETAMNKQNGSLWLHGYWKFDWADNYVRVLNISLETNTVNIDPATPVVYNLTANARFMIVNSLWSLDEAEEYFIDTTSKQLYIHQDYTETSVTLSNVTFGMQAFGKSNLQLKNVSITHSKITNLQLINVNNCTVSGGYLGFSGSNGLYMVGTNTHIVNNDISETGCAALGVLGGNETTLEPSGNTVTDNVISRFGDWTRTYNPGVSFRGVGHFIARNQVHTGPHQGLQGGGNDHYFTYNNVSSLCYETRDSSAWYMGRSWATRNNTLTHNTFSDIQMLEITTLGSDSVQAIYHDDQISQSTVTNNTFINCHVGVFIGGGRHHVVKYNNFINVTYPVHVDDRGLNWQAASCTPPNGDLWQGLRAVNYEYPPYSTHYPDLLNIDKPCYPIHNNISLNKWCGSQTKSFKDFTDAQAASWGVTLLNNTHYDC
eukprot:TRINITY_DN8014_c0_g1_i1.p1 TRINITY_DN8014_c0_g1~~TRINITY_DN8014_c0_g1_i1.p1  ORF type:complete len:605 (+),score=87.65 TRINITY_DN8014_c0_g1_i1:71-1885(+)